MTMSAVTGRAAVSCARHQASRAVQAREQTPAVTGEKACACRVSAKGVSGAGSFGARIRPLARLLTPLVWLRVELARQAKWPGINLQDRPKRGKSNSLKHKARKH